MTADGVSVFLVEDDRTTVLQVSPQSFPNVVRQSIEKIEVAREVLGDDLGKVIPVPLDDWQVSDISCALFEELTPISRNRLQRFVQLNRIKSPVLAWLRQVATLDRGPAKEARSCLQALSQCPYQTLRAAAGRALDSPLPMRATVMHGDLTLGNVMLDPSGMRDFMIIDWGGSSVDGFPIFDLVKFAEAARLPPKSLQAELAAHAAALGCEIQDTRSYLVAALGHIWRNLEQFPPDRFSAMAAHNLNTLDAALNG